MHNYILSVCVTLVGFLLCASAPAGNDEPSHPGTLIAVNKSEASASLLDLKTGKHVARIATGNAPHEVAVSPDGTTAVVGNYGDRREPGRTLTVIDLRKQKAVKTIDLKAYHRPHGIVFLPNGTRVVVTCETERVLLIVNIETGEVEDAVETKARISHMVAVTPDASRAFVSSIGSGTITAIDLHERAFIKELEAGAGAEGIDVSPDGREVWVTNRSADTISIFNAQTLEKLDTLNCDSFPIRLKFTPDGKHALVSNARSGDVAIFDTARRELVKRLSMKATAVEKKDDRLFGDTFDESPVPIGILVHPNGKRAYVANTNADIITVIDLEALEIVDRLTAGEEPDGLALCPMDLVSAGSVE